MESRTEDLFLLWMIVVIGLIPIVGAFFGAARWGVQPAVGVLMVLAGLVELIRERKTVQSS